ncbi:MAG: NADP-dependent isocitrate dehydrogenase, partial [Micrococcaceae bacterium]|nr:NADP-dependent isocitrate dehydrogenase [Micrococcaceae bacterium]
LRANEDVIVNELNEVQGKEVSINGYYYPNDELTSEVMRPSATLNSIIENMSA